MRIRIAPPPPAGRNALTAALATALVATAASADSLTVQSISGPAPSLGRVVSANSGTSVFQISASSGMVTQLSGTAYRPSGSSPRPLVTLACGSDSLCATSDVAVTVSSIGSPTGRAGPLGNFTIEGMTAQVKSGPSGTDPVTFTIGPIGNNATRTFYIGADFPILGDESGSGTGAATSAFQVTAQFSPSGTSVTAMGNATATVFRPLTLSCTGNLVFGTIVKPLTGTGTVAIDAATGAPTFTGDGVRGVGAASRPASYDVTGEGGQAFTLSIPDNFSMSGPNNSSIQVALTATAGGPQTLGGSLGSSASTTFGIGGSFALGQDTQVGAYSGSFTVTVQYQ